MLAWSLITGCFEKDEVGKQYNDGLELILMPFLIIFIVVVFALDMLILPIEIIGFIAFKIMKKKGYHIAD